MESLNTAGSFASLGDISLLAKISEGRLKRGRGLMACAVFLCLGFFICVSGAYAQNAGLYKDGKKILDLGEMIDSSLQAGQAAPAAPFQMKPARMKLLEEVFGDKIPSKITPQKEYVRLVLECRDIVQRRVSSDQTDSAFGLDVDCLLALEAKLAQANKLLLEKFNQTEKSLEENGYPEHKIQRHTQMVENHTVAANRLAELLASLRAAHESDGQAAVEGIIRELEQYFIDNIFRQEPPLLSSQPLPVMMQVKEAPVIEHQLPAAIPYARISKGERGPQKGDLDPTIDVQFTDDIINLAASLNNSPVEMYNYVRDNFEFEAYLGSRKGSQQTLNHKRGNDYDQASLLIALLRVSGIPARYAHGEVIMPIDRALDWLGFKDKLNAGNLLATAGMDAVIYISGSDTVALGCRRIWVEAWIPFINYRGAINDSTGFMWVPMDPPFKQYSYEEAFNLPAEMGFDGGAFVNDYISTFHEEAPIELFKQMLLDSLPLYHPEADYEDLIRKGTVIKETDGILPGTLPYDLISFDGVFSEIPSDKRYRIRFHVHGSGTDLDYETSLPEIVEKQLTISYVGATPADQEIIDTAGGIFNVDIPYLVDLKPVLKIDGCEVAWGTGSVMMGMTHYSDMHFTTPVGDFNEVPVVYNYITAGNYQGIGIDTEDAFPSFFDVPETSCPEDYLGQELHQTALTYLNNVDVASDEAADLMHIRVVNGVAEAIVENTLRVFFSGGLPVTFEWTGMIVDADRRIIGPFSIHGVNNSCDYMLLVGAEGSIQENRLFEDRFGEEAISAIKILELASDSGITVCEITYSIAAECPGINQPAYVISAINNALAQGHHVIIPERQFTYYLWTGTGWIDIDPTTCAAGYIIAGGHNGGSTVDEWDITYPDLLCIQPIGPIEVMPSSPNDLYCFENNAHWVFEVPTINYWGKDEDGNCVLLQSPKEYFIVKYSINEIATRWGPGDYIFEVGSNTTECGCTRLEKKVTIFRVEITSLGFTMDHDISEWPGGWVFTNVYGKSFLGKDIPVWTESGTNDPICYTKNTPVTMFATFKVSPSLDTPISTGVRIKAMVAGSEIGHASQLIISGTTIDDQFGTDGVVDGIGGIYTIPNSDGVKTLNVTFDWEISVDYAVTYCRIGKSGPHKLHFTDATPLENPLYDLALDSACAYVGGSPNMAAQLNQKISQRISYNPSINVPGHPLKLLISRRGQCNNHADLMACLLKSVGVASSVVYIWGGCDANTVDFYRYGSWNPGFYAGPSFRVMAPRNDECPAHPRFTFHAITFSGGVYYDPSYGKTGMISLAEKAPAGVPYWTWWPILGWISEPLPHPTAADRQTGANYPPPNAHKVDWNCLGP